MSVQQSSKPLDYEKYQKKAKKIHFKINVEKNEEKHIKLFKKQLEMFTNNINQISNIVKKRTNTE